MKLRHFVLAAMLAGGSLGVEAQPSPQPTTAASVTSRPTRHIILMDISGSLRTRGYATHTGWTPILPQLWSKLFATDDVLSPATSDVVFQPFSDAITDAKENRHPVGPFTVADFPSHIPELPFPGGGATDMARALDMGRDLGMEAGAQKRSLVWLITDNENNLESNKDDQEFYRRLRDSGDYSHVMFFPIADPSVRKGDNVVMYLLAPKGQWETPEIEKIAAAVATKTGYDGILFRPLYTAPGASALDFSKELTVEGRLKHRVTQEGGTTVLHFQEGEKFDGQLKFRIRSRLKGWKLQKAHLDDADVVLELPHLYAPAVGGAKADQKTHWQVTPKVLTVEPQKETAEFFLLQLGGPGGKPLTLSRSTADQLLSPFTKYLPEIHGKVTMKARVDLTADQIKTEIPAAMHDRLASVPNLPEIEHFMVLQQDQSGNDTSKTERQIEWERNLVVRVEADSSPAMVLAGIAALVLLGLLGLAAAVVLFKHNFQLEGPGMEEEIPLPYVSGKYLVCDKDGKALFYIRSSWGSLRLETAPDHVLNADSHILPVRWEGDEFRFECTEEGHPAQVFWLRRKQGSSHKADASGGGSVL